MEITSEPIVFNPSTHTPLIPAIAAVHLACMTVDGTIANFLPPLSLPKIINYWTNYAHDPTRTIILQLAGASTDQTAVAGIVGLATAGSPDRVNETGRFRGGVEKLLVSPDYRQRGIARRIMGRLEEEARKLEMTVLTLETEAGSPAEDVYPRLGWIRVGVVPKHEVSPADGQLRDTTIFYRDLTKLQ